MAKILFRMRQVPDDEADEVRQLLDDNAIDWYETDAGRFQISFPAIWLRDESQEPRARQLIDDYQQRRAARLRDEHERNIANGEVETFTRKIASNPVPMILALLAIAFILYISINPFLALNK